MNDDVYTTNFNFKNMQNSPRTVNGVFDAFYGEINSLSGSSRIIGRIFNVHFNKLFSMDFLPMNIGFDSLWKESSIRY